MIVYHNVELRKNRSPTQNFTRDHILLKLIYLPILTTIVCWNWLRNRKQEDCSYNVTRYKFIAVRKDFKQQSDLFEIDLFQMHL